MASYCTKSERRLIDAAIEYAESQEEWRKVVLGCSTDYNVEVENRLERARARLLSTALDMLPHKEPVHNKPKKLEEEDGS